MLPTYVIIGAMKGGTTSLHRYFSAHPQISTSKKKELNFFKTEKDFAKGIPWYTSQFDASYSVRGECSPNYAKFHLFPGVPQRMYSVVPDCKLIYIVRNPIERAISHYLHNWSAGIESRPLSEAFQTFDSNYILTGDYLFQLEKFLKYYPQNQLLVLLSEDLRNEREATLARCFQFLGVDDSFICEDFQLIHHRTAAKRRKRPLVQLTRRHFPILLTLARKLLPSSAVGKLSKIAEAPVPLALIDPELRARLEEHYAPCVQALSCFLGGRTLNWFGKERTSV